MYDARYKKDTLRKEGSFADTIYHNVIARWVGIFP
jgi:hypothetical protein